MLGARRDALAPAEARVERPNIRYGSMGRRLVAAAVGANLFVVGLVAISLERSRLHIRGEAAVTGQNLARLLETAIGASFDQVDLALQAAADEHLRQARAGGIDRAAFEGFLTRARTRAPILLSMRATEALVDRTRSDESLRKRDPRRERVRVGGP
jgi:hypothetical protein